MAWYQQEFCRRFTPNKQIRSAAKVNERTMLCLSLSFKLPVCVITCLKLTNHWLLHFLSDFFIEIVRNGISEIPSFKIICGACPRSPLQNLTLHHWLLISQLYNMDNTNSVKKPTAAGLSISFEVDIPTGKVGGSLLFEHRRREFSRGVWGHAPPPRKFWNLDAWKCNFNAF